MAFLSYETKMHAFVNVYTNVHGRVYAWEKEKRPDHHVSNYVVF